MTLPWRAASASMSKTISLFAATPIACATALESAIPSPGAIFSTTAKARWSEATSVVLSGVTRPRRIERPASMNSAAITMSTSPDVGASDSTGFNPSNGGMVST